MLEVRKRRRRATVWKGSAELQEYELCTQDGVDVDTDEGMEELAFVPSAVRYGWLAQGQIDGDKRAGFKFFDIAAVKEDRTRSTSVRVATV